MLWALAPRGPSAGGGAVARQDAAAFEERPLWCSAGAAQTSMPWRSSDPAEVCVCVLCVCTLRCGR